MAACNGRYTGCNIPGRESGPNSICGAIVARRLHMSKRNPEGTRNSPSGKRASSDGSIRKRKA